MLFACSFFHALAVLAAHLFYWYWCIASLIVMWVFSLVDWVALFGLTLWIGIRLKQEKP